MAISIPSLALQATGDALLTAFAVAAASTVVAHAAGLSLYSSPSGGSGGARQRRGSRPHGADVELHFLLSGGPRHLVLQALSFVSAGPQ